MSLAEKDGKHYVRCEADFTDKTPITLQQGGNESEERLKPKEAKLQAQAHTQTFTLRHRDWVYEISSYDAQNLTKSPTDLLEDKVVAVPDDLLENLVTLPNQTSPSDEPNQPIDPNA